MKKVILTFIMALGCYAAWGIDINKELHEVLKSALLKAGYPSKYYDKDNSMNINDNGVNYWFQLEASEKSGLVFVRMQRKGFRTKGKDAYKLEPAIKAINEVNKKHFNVKMFCDNDSSIRIQQQFVVKTTADLKPEIIKNSIVAMCEATETFKKAYTTYEKTYTKQANDIAKEKADTVVVVEQEEPSNVVVSSFGIASVDFNGKELIAEPTTRINKAKAKFLIPVVTMEAMVAGSYTMNVKIYNSKNQLLKPSNEATYTTTQDVDIKKANKAASYDLGRFGNANGSVWTAGKYKVEIFEGDILVMTDNFTIVD